MANDEDIIITKEGIELPDLGVKYKVPPGPAGPIEITEGGVRLPDLGVSMGIRRTGGGGFVSIAQQAKINKEIYEARLEAERQRKAREEEQKRIEEKRIEDQAREKSRIARETYRREAALAKNREEREAAATRLYQALGEARVEYTGSRVQKGIVESAAIRTVKGPVAVTPETAKQFVKYGRKQYYPPEVYEQLEEQRKKELAKAWKEGADLYFTPAGVRVTPGEDKGFIASIKKGWTSAESAVSEKTTKKVLKHKWENLVGTETQISDELSKWRKEWQKQKQWDLHPSWKKAQEYSAGKLGGVYESVREKPLKTTATFAAFVAMPPATKVLGAGISKIPLLPKAPSWLGKAVGIGLTTAYTGSVGYRLYTEPTAYRKGFKAGEILTTEITPMIAGYKVGAYGLRRYELKAEFKKQIKQLPPKQRTIFEKQYTELKRLSKKGAFKNIQVKELSLAGVERVPKKYRTPLQEFLKQQDDIIVSGSVAQQAQLKQKFTQTDIDIIAKGNAVEKALETKRFLKSIGVKRVSTPKATEITIAGKKAIEYHELTQMFKPSVEKVLPWYRTYKGAVVKTPSGTELMKLETQAYRKLIGGLIERPKTKGVRDIAHLTRIIKEVKPLKTPKPKSIKRTKDIFKVPEIISGGVGRGLYPSYPKVSKTYPFYPTKPVSKKYPTYPSVEKQIKKISLYPRRKPKRKGFFTGLGPKPRPTPSKYPTYPSGVIKLPPLVPPSLYPPSKPPKKPPKYPIWFKLGKGKLKEEKYPKMFREDILFTPSFTAQQLKITERTTPKKFYKKLQRGFTGLELRPVPLFTSKRKRKTKKRRRKR